MKLSYEIGVKKAASQLGLQYFTLAEWRKNRKAAAKMPDRQPMPNSVHGRLFRKRPEEVKTGERHLFIVAFRNIYPVSLMYRVLKVSESRYYRWLRKRRITQSLSGTGLCFDNARMESFFATLKKEKLYRIPTYRMTREEVKTVIFRYVFTYYNAIRVYTGNPYRLSPVKYWEWFRQSTGKPAA